MNHPNQTNHSSEKAAVERILPIGLTLLHDFQPTLEKNTSNP
jgi:hypothetical protein